MDGDLINTRAGFFSQETGLDAKKAVICPFCLRRGILQQFLVSTKDGISQSRGKCPFCDNGMLMRNLLAPWTPEKYAEWAFGYAASGFWQKIKFEAWKKELNALGWAQAFWDKYRSLKGEAQEEGGDSESFMDYINRKGQEQAEEWNKEDRSQEQGREMA
jgi:hypothetical protein